MAVSTLPRGMGHYSTSLVPFPADVAIDTSGEWKKASTQALCVPKSLLDFYDQRISVQLAGELFNIEAALIAVNESETALNGIRYAQILGAQPYVQRRVSELVEISDLFQTGQIITLTLQARRPNTAVFYVCRNLTLVLYFGSVTIGRQVGS